MTKHPYKIIEYFTSKYDDVNKTWKDIEFIPITFSEEYRKEWNIHQNDFVKICKNGEPLNDSIYRIGGFGPSNKEDYMLLLKHIESLYDDHITTDPKGKKHLASYWCIVDKNGVEKYVSDKRFDHLTLHGIVFSKDNKFYNIETGELYCKAYDYIKTDNYIILDNKYDDDESKRGAIKINLKTGEKELIN